MKSTGVGEKKGDTPCVTPVRSNNFKLNKTITTTRQMLAHRLVLASIIVASPVDAFSTLPPHQAPFRKVSSTALPAEKSSPKHDVLATLAAVGIWAASGATGNAEVIRTMDFRYLQPHRIQLCYYWLISSPLLRLDIDAAKKQ